jgi:hypothetical protein
LLCWSHTCTTCASRQHTHAAKPCSARSGAQLFASLHNQLQLTYQLSVFPVLPLLLLLLLPAPRHVVQQALDRFQKSFWSRQFRPLAAGEDNSKAAGAANDKQARTTTPGDNVAALDYSGEHSRYSREDRYEAVHDDEPPRYGRDGAEPACGDWPECRGTCDSGKCELEKHYSGCCYLAATHGGDDYPAIDSEKAKATHLGDSSDDAVPLNMAGKRGMRVCW